MSLTQWAGVKNTWNTKKKIRRIVQDVLNKYEDKNEVTGTNSNKFNINKGVKRRNLSNLHIYEEQN